MVRRLLAFAFAFVVFGAPVAGDICDALCADHTRHSINLTAAASHHHHHTDLASQALHHHHSAALTAAAAAGLALRAASHQCVQADAVITESRELSRGPTVGVATHVAVVAPTLARVMASLDVNGQHRPPVPIRSTAPLRI